MLDCSECSCLEVIVGGKGESVVYHCKEYGEDLDMSDFGSKKGFCRMEGGSEKWRCHMEGGSRDLDMSGFCRMKGGSADCP